MDIAHKNIKEEFETFNKLMPVQTAFVCGGQEFSYRYYRNMKPDKDVTLLFLAGGTGLADGAFMIFRALTDKYSLMTFNYPLAFPTNAALSDALAELLSQIKASNVYLVGQSYGGLFAQVMAKRHPESVKGLILSGTCSLSNDVKYNGMLKIMRFLDLKRRKKYLLFDRYAPVKLLVPFLKLILKKHSPDKASAKYLSGIVDEIKSSITNKYWYHLDLLLADLANDFGTHKPEHFTSFHNEVLLFFSKDDKLFGEELSDALVRLMPSPIVADLQGGHLAMFLYFDDYLAKIKDFIDRRN